MSEKNINILLVEDHKLIRVGIKSIFDEAEGYNVIGEAENGIQAISKAQTLYPDIVLLDLGLPDIDGTKILKEISEKVPSTKIIILSSHNNEEEIEMCLEQGIYAYIIKDINTEMLLHIVKTVFDGAMWFDPKIVPILRNKTNSTRPQKQTSRAMFRNSHANLTQREYEVLKLVVDGKSNNEIAEILCISEHTAKAHVCNIIQKLVVDDRTQAAVKAIKEGLV